VTISRTSDAWQKGDTGLSHRPAWNRESCQTPQDLTHMLQCNHSPQHSLLCSFCSFVSLRMYVDSGKLKFVLMSGTDILLVLACTITRQHQPCLIFTTSWTSTSAC